MSEITQTYRFRIEDDDAVNLLLQNGFICERPEHESKPGIHFYTQPIQVDQSRWFDTNCPVPFNGTYTLLDGHILRSVGTLLLKQ